MYDNIDLGSLLASMFILRTLLAQCSLWFHSIMAAVDISPLFSLSEALIHAKTEKKSYDATYQGEISGDVACENVSFAYQSVNAS